jgi:hypothetical protein
MIGLSAETKRRIAVRFGASPSTAADGRELLIDNSEAPERTDRSNYGHALSGLSFA